MACNADFGLLTSKVNFALHVALKSILCKNKALGFKNMLKTNATSKSSMSLKHYVDFNVSFKSV